MSGLSTHSGLALADLAKHRGLESLASIDGMGLAAGSIVGLPTPLYYYALEVDGTPTGGNVDETGTLDFDNRDQISSGAGVSGYGAVDNNAVAQGQLWRESGSGLNVALTHLAISVWVMRPTEDAYVMVGATYSGSPGLWELYTYPLVLLDTEIAVDSVWHHVLCYYTSGTGWRRIIDAGSPVNVSGSADDANFTTLPHLLLSSGAALDEVAYLDAGTDITDELAGGLATSIYNHGVGRFYRSGSGWSE